MYETNLSAEQYQKKKDPRFSGAHGNPRGSQCPQTTARQGAQAVDRHRAPKAGADLVTEDGMSPRGAQRLPKTARLRKRAEYLRLSRTGASVQSTNFVIITKINDRSECRLGVTVSAKVGNSVIRNRIKRWVREYFRRHRAELPCGIDILIIARKTAAGLGGHTVARELEKVLAGQRKQPET